MKIRLSELRRVIREEISRSSLSLKVAKAHSDFASDPSKWRMARPDIQDMAAGGDAGGIRDEYYPDWTDDEFRQLWTEMGQDPDELDG